MALKKRRKAEHILISFQRPQKVPEVLRNAEYVKMIFFWVLILNEITSEVIIQEEASNGRIFIR